MPRQSEVLSPNEMQQRLALMFPNAIPEWRDTLCDLAFELWDFYHFNRLRWVHFCGQIHAETNGLSLRKMEENMAFRSQKRILEVYRYRLGLALQKEPKLKAKHGSVENLAKSLINQPKELADLVYGGREGTPWRKGSVYIGRGPTQITHLNNYKAVGEEIARQPGGDKFDLVGNPGLLSTDPELGVRSAFADWHIKGLSRYADKDDCETLSDALNTGNIRDNIKPHGLPDRKRGTATAKTIWPRAFTLTEEVVETVPLPLPQEKPSVSDLVKVSRKVRVLVRLRNAIYTVFGMLSFASIMEALDYIQGVYDGIEHFAKNHVFALVGTIVLACIGTISYLLACTREDVQRGDYVPSGLAPGVDPGPAGTALAGPLPGPGANLESAGNGPAAAKA